MKVAWYITAHGYGHAVRSCAVLAAWARRMPDLDLTVVSGIPVDFLTARLPGARFTRRPEVFDVGMVQRDSVQVDLGATRARVEAWLARRPHQATMEADWIRDRRPDVVVADIPGIPLAAARAAGVPAVAVGNFSWDWIYAPFAEGGDRVWMAAVDAFREDYAKADLLIRLPFAPAMEAFPRQVEVGLPVRPGQARRAELARLTGADPAAIWVLVSFTTLAWGPEALTRAATDPALEFFTVLPLAWDHPRFHAVDRRSVPFADVLATSDVVLSKPGFGIVSECIANRKPLVHAERRDFAEYPLLRDGIEQHLAHAFLSEADLYAGRMHDAVRAALARPMPPPALSLQGADEAVDRILELASG